MITYNDLYNDMMAHYLSHDTIAREAYAIWEKEGRPDGDAPFRPEYPNFFLKTVKEWHWYWAKVKLENALEMDTDFLWAVSDFGVKYQMIDGKITWVE